ncbi:hypothetical protein Hanom_Chr15g01400521 [Helianthus anomalus]
MFIFYFLNSLIENSVEVIESTSLGSMGKSVEEEFLESKDFFNICDVFSFTTVYFFVNIKLYTTS